MATNRLPDPRLNAVTQKVLSAAKDTLGERLDKASDTLKYAQNLYEQKILTYPRTDSRFITEDMAHE